jgi:glycerophosphoryl diester phosphodiesterase
MSISKFTEGLYEVRSCIKDLRESAHPFLPPKPSIPLKRKTLKLIATRTSFFKEYLPKTEENLNLLLSIIHKGKEIVDFEGEFEQLIDAQLIEFGTSRKNRDEMEKIYVSLSVPHRIIKECFPDPVLRRRVIEHGKAVAEATMKPGITDEEIWKLVDEYVQILREIDKENAQYVDLKEAEKSYPEIRQAMYNYLKMLYEIVQKKLKTDSHFE